MPQKPEDRDYQEENRRYKSKPEQIEKRVARNKARRQLEREGLVKKGDGKHVDHKKPLNQGGSNARSNLRVMDDSDNMKRPRGKYKTGK